MADEMKTKTDPIWTGAEAAGKKAVEAYDKLVAELDKDPAAGDAIDADAVITEAGQVWVNSLKYAAELWLTPTKIAEAVQETNSP